MEDCIGQRLGNYRFLGQGGFADVYLGEHYVWTPMLLSEVS